MEIEHYENIRRSADSQVFLFISPGPKGNLIKLVNFTLLEKLPDTYNLALGTLKTNNEADFEETSDNKDRDKILATVFYIAESFSSKYPNAKIMVSGRDAATTRLYRGAINHEYQNIKKTFLVEGGFYNISGDSYLFEWFVPNKNYDVFLFTRK